MLLRVDTKPGIKVLHTSLLRSDRLMKIRYKIVICLLIEYQCRYFAKHYLIKSTEVDYSMIIKNDASFSKIVNNAVFYYKAQHNSEDMAA